MPGPEWSAVSLNKSPKSKQHVNKDYFYIVGACAGPECHRRVWSVVFQDRKVQSPNSYVQGGSVEFSSEWSVASKTEKFKVQNRSMWFHEKLK